jgi:hypothetical protein
MTFGINGLTSVCALLRYPRVLISTTKNSIWIRVLEDQNPSQVFQRFPDLTLFNVINEMTMFQWDNDVRFALDQHAYLDFYSSSSLEQQSASWHFASLGHIILIPSQAVFGLTP